MLCTPCEAVFKLPLTKTYTDREWSGFSKEQTTFAQLKDHADQGCYCCHSVLRQLTTNNLITELGRDEIQLTRTLLIPESLELRESRSIVQFSLRQLHEKTSFLVVIFFLEKLPNRGKVPASVLYLD
jgi:hypothetical protein